MPYEDVAEPSDVTEAFLRSDSAAAQAQAAALLAIGWQLSGDPATDLAADVFEYVGLRFSRVELRTRCFGPRDPQPSLQ
jgi:hypothetical protein